MSGHFYEHSGTSESLNIVMGIIPGMSSPAHPCHIALVICMVALLAAQVSAAITIHTSAGGAQSSGAGNSVAPGLAAVPDPAPGDLSVTRGSRFTTTISGPSYTSAFVWVHGTSGLSGAPGDQPPILAAGQDGVAQDPAGGPYAIGSYQFSGGGGRTLRDDVPAAPAAGTGYYARVDLGGSGSVTLGWVTSINTKTGSYDIRVERSSGGSVRTDDVSVTVTEGSLTAGTSGTITGYVGGELVLTGTNTETGTTYLFITGPNLPASGGRLDNPGVAVTDGDPSSFTRVQVGDNGQWQYTWEIANIDPGTYTVFAESDPRSLANLGSTGFSSTSVVLGAATVTSAPPTITTTFTTVPTTASTTTASATPTQTSTAPPSTTRAGVAVPAIALAATAVAGWLTRIRWNR